MQSPAVILDLSDVEIVQLSRTDFQAFDIGASGDVIKRLYKAYGALWEHSGDPAMPHVQLTSGKHSNQYFNSAKLAFRAPLGEFLARQFLGLFELATEDVVIGPSYGANFLAADLATVFGCNRAYTERDTGKEQTWTGRWAVPVGGKVQLCEDVISTGGSTLKTKRAVQSASVESVRFHDRVACLVNRSGLDELEDGTAIVALLRFAVEAWVPHDCPLCKAGSVLVGDVKKNWARLTGTTE